MKGLLVRNLAKLGCSSAAPPTRLREVEGALVMQSGQVVEDIGLDFFWFGFRVNLLQLADDLLDGVLSVAALDNFQAWAIEAQCALRHKQDTLLIVFTEATAGSESWMRLQVRCHALFSLGTKAPGGGQPGFT